MAKIEPSLPLLATLPSLSEFPILQPSPLTGLARTAAEAPLDSTGCLTEYRPLTSRTILNKVTSNRRMPFSHAINPYRGCEFACRYCYARYTHEFLEMGAEQFERKIYFKQNAGWLLEQELKRLKPGTEIAIGTATDPYQPLERKLKITRSLLEVFARHSGFRLGIISKSALISRDIDLLKEIAKNNKLTVHTTVTTMNAKLARKLEPRAPRPDLRMRTVAELREAGLRAGVMCSPLMPGITDGASSIRAVARAAAAAGASFMASGALFLKPCSLPTFLEFVGEHFPEQLGAYKRRYAGSAFVSQAYRERMAALVDQICREFKLGKRYLYEDAAKEEGAPAVEMQPWLPFAGAPRQTCDHSASSPIALSS
ncbi:MAG TPA: radical SAM protein [Acidobacteriaceae bacterium]|jgi:DNA repair photolyase|nr:radical SAM protein [Acidobacteriaceae bacterium]